MQGQPLVTGTLSALTVMLVVMALAAGFSVDLTQALSQSMPLVMISGIVVTLTTLLMRRELA